MERGAKGSRRMRVRGMVEATLLVLMPLTKLTRSLLMYVPLVDPRSIRYGRTILVILSSPSAPASSFCVIRNCITCRGAAQLVSESECGERVVEAVHREVMAVSSEHRVLTRARWVI